MSRLLRLIIVVVLFACLPASLAAQTTSGSEACKSCHQKIYECYSKTPMANASGLAIKEVIPGEFRHTKSGEVYRIYEQEGKAWLSFERLGDSSVKGVRELLYYIGSNRTGRSYLFSTDGFLFESPVNWYAQKHIWDMAPAYQDAREIPLNLPAVSDCLTCHSSGMKPPMSGTENRYTMPAIAHPGVTCQRCHGEDVAHANGKGHSINPIHLSPERRDAICMQCHLEGTVAINRPGKHLYDFKPGDTLNEYISYFVLKDKQTERNPALSQVQALAQSVCKQKSGDRMSCMSCHDPHSTPARQERVAFYRAKCLNCHGQSFADRHHQSEPDCTSCHMPFTMGTIVAHTQTTDHRILRKPPTQLQLAWADNRPDLPHLVPFPDNSGKDHERELALAWESMAEGGMQSAVSEANRLLQSAAQRNPNDPDLLSALGYIEQRRGNRQQAADLYRRALKSDPDRIDAAMNLGVIDAQLGQLGDAVKLWQRAFHYAPWRTPIGMNLAYAFCGSAQYQQARDYVLRVLEFDPDLDRAKKLLSSLNSEHPSCGP
jgi:tetratricopeptide (TPR) repeat protein